MKSLEMKTLESVTVELFDYWLRNSFFWEFGTLAPLTLNARVTSEGEIEGGDGGHIGINPYKGDLLGMRVLVTLRKYDARYLMQERQGNAYKAIGEILIEQLQTDSLRVHCYEAEGSGFAVKFWGWRDRVYGGNQPASRIAAAGPREFTLIKATVAHYAITKLKIEKGVAYGLAAISGKTYLKIEAAGLLLSASEFKRRTGETISGYWEKNTLSG